MCWSLDSAQFKYVADCVRFADHRRFRDSAMKPDAIEAMAHLISQIRSTFPFGQSSTQIRAGPCQGCSMKLLGYLEMELDAWDARLDAGERPSLAELSRLSRTARKIARVLEKSGLMPTSAPSPESKPPPRRIAG